MPEIIKNGYKTILCDPPWPEKGGGVIRRGADRHYDLMSVKAIAALPVQNLVHPHGAHLYLWTTNNYLADAITILQGWGFIYKTCITWQKNGNPGLGQYFRGLSEHVLFAVTKTRLPYKTIAGKRAQGVTAFTSPRKEHSCKPDELRQMAERVSYSPRIELFARENCPDWTCVGAELDLVLLPKHRRFGTCSSRQDRLFVYF